jgi:hypothetical protein
MILLLESLTMVGIVGGWAGLYYAKREREAKRAERQQAQLRDQAATSAAVDEERQYGLPLAR